jgi:hypothetical protein
MMNHNLEMPKERFIRLTLALEGCASDGNTVLAMELLKWGADIRFDEYVIFRTMGQFNQVTMFRALLNYDLDAADPAADRMERMTAAFVGTAMTGNVEFARVLINAGVDMYAHNGEAYVLTIV